MVVEEKGCERKKRERGEREREREQADERSLLPRPPCRGIVRTSMARGWAEGGRAVCRGVCVCVRERERKSDRKSRNDCAAQTSGCSR